MQCGIALADSVLLTGTTWYMTVSIFRRPFQNFYRLGVLAENPGWPDQRKGHLLSPPLLCLVSVRNLPQCWVLVVKPRA